MVAASVRENASARFSNATLKLMRWSSGSDGLSSQRRCSAPLIWHFASKERHQIVTAHNTPESIERECKPLPGIGIKFQNVLSLSRQCVKPPPHICNPCGMPNTRVAGDRGQTASPRTRLSTTVNALGPSTRMRRPSNRVMSTRLADTDQVVGDGTFGQTGSWTVLPTISTGRNTASSPGASATGAKRGSFCQVWIIFAFTAYLRVT